MGREVGRESRRWEDYFLRHSPLRLFRRPPRRSSFLPSSTSGHCFYIYTSRGKRTCLHLHVSLSHHPSTPPPHRHNISLSDSPLQALRAEIDALKSSSALAVISPTPPSVVATNIAEDANAEIQMKLASYQNFMANYIVNAQNQKLLGEIVQENCFRPPFFILFGLTGFRNILNNTPVARFSFPSRFCFLLLLFASSPFFLPPFVIAKAVKDAELKAERKFQERLERLMTSGGMMMMQASAARARRRRRRPFPPPP
jgi:hypothetical protein